MKKPIRQNPYVEFNPLDIPPDDEGRRGDGPGETLAAATLKPNSQTERKKITLREEDAEAIRRALIKRRQAYIYRIDESKKPKRQINESIDIDSFKAVAKDFVSYAASYLNLQETPPVVLKPTLEGNSFASWSPGKIELCTSNRHPMDVFRSLAHELVHQKQYECDVLHNESGQTGSEHENEANALAGVIMRNYAKLNPDLFELEPVEAHSINRTLKESICLMKKGQKANIPYEILSEVFDRGIDSWTSKEKLTPSEYAFNRVNSFISGGRARKLDSDLLTEQKGIRRNVR